MSTSPVSEAEWDAIEAFANEARADFEPRWGFHLFQSLLFVAAAYVVIVVLLVVL